MKAATRPIQPETIDFIARVSTLCKVDPKAEALIVQGLDILLGLALETHHKANREAAARKRRRATRGQA